MAGKEADSFAQEAANRVREIVASAEQRAEEILSEAREEAARTRERAQDEARERLDEVRRALQDLEGSLGRGANAPAAPPPPEREPEVAAPAAEAEEAPPAIEEAPAEPETASTDELIEQLKSGAEEKKGASDAGAARLVAMKMALDGASRDEIDKHLADSYCVPNRKKLVDEVLARVGS